MVKTVLLMTAEAQPKLKEMLEQRGCEVSVAGLSENVQAGRAADLILIEAEAGEKAIRDWMASAGSRGRNCAVAVLAADAQAPKNLEFLRDGACDVAARPLTDAALDMLLARAGRQQTMAAESAYYRSCMFDATEEVVGRSEGIRLVSTAVDKAVATRAPVLIVGEPGTGKDLFARILHRRTLGASAPLIRVDCAALPGSMLENEVFGRASGQSSGRAIGLLELARGGTLVLDGIGASSGAFQARLLALLEESGKAGAAPLPRLVCLSRADLRPSVEAGTFDGKLLPLISVHYIEIPPLCQRTGDIALIAEFLVRRTAAEMHRPNMMLHSSAREALAAYAWPGNIRELKACIERAVYVSEAGAVMGESLGLGGATSSQSAKKWAPPAAASMPQSGGESAPSRPAQILNHDEIVFRVGQSMADVERDVIQRTVASTGGNRTKAATILGISVRTLYSKLLEYGKGNAAGEEHGAKSA